MQGARSPDRAARRGRSGRPRNLARETRPTRNAGRLAESPFPPVVGPAEGVTVRSTTYVVLACAAILLVVDSASAHVDLPEDAVAVGGAALVFEVRGDGGVADLGTGLLGESKLLDRNAGPCLSNPDGFDSSCVWTESTDSELRVARGKPRPRAKPRK